MDEGKMRLQMIAGFFSVLLVSMSMMLSGCGRQGAGSTVYIPEATSPAPLPTGQQGNVSIIDGGVRVHIDDKITAEDMIALAGKVTEKMLASSEMSVLVEARKKTIIGCSYSRKHDY